MSCSKTLFVLLEGFWNIIFLIMSFQNKKSNFPHFSGPITATLYQLQLHLTPIKSVKINENKKTRTTTKKKHQNLQRNAAHAYVRIFHSLTTPFNAKNVFSLRLPSLSNNNITVTATHNHQPTANSWTAISRWATTTKRLAGWNCRTQQTIGPAKGTVTWVRMSWVL